MTTRSTLERPCIFEYNDYRRYLKDFYAHKKSQKGAGFSFRSLAKAAGYSSPNFFKLVMDGQRNMSDESITRIALVLKLSKQEAVFFFSLVHMNQAQTSEERERFAAELMNSAGFRKIHPLKEAQYNFYAKWYIAPIRELIATADFQEDPEWIAKQMTPPITAREAKVALDELQTLGMVRRDESGRLLQVNNLVNTSDEVMSTSLSRYHKQMIRLAGESIDRFSRYEREISSATLSVSEDCAKKVKQLIQEFREQILQLAAEDTSTCERVYQVNFQLFPMSGKPGGTGGTSNGAV
ncbi:MAG: TIGR02147 family protein [Bacteriovoracia bacterium]